MAAGTAPIFPSTPWAATADLTAASACTTRGPIAHASLTATPCFAVAVSPTSTNGRRIDTIQVRASSTAIGAATVAQTVLIWMSNGTTAYVIDEIPVTAQTPSSAAPAFNISKSYSNLVLPAGFSLYVSTTVATTVSTTALSVSAFGGDY